MRGATSKAVRRVSFGTCPGSPRRIKDHERVHAVASLQKQLPHLFFIRCSAFGNLGYVAPCIDLYGRFHVAVEVRGEVSDTCRGEQNFSPRSGDILLFSPSLPH